MTTERKYQVFISSTYADLQEARQSLLLSLLGMGMIPTGMELHSGGADSQWPAIQKVINECDYYLVLVGGRYGSLSPIGLSYTHREFVYAATKGKPMLALLHDSPDFLPPEQREPTREGEVRFNDFRQLLQNKCLTRFWHSPDDLGDVARKAMAQMVIKHPASGWVRAGEAAEAMTRLEVQRLTQRVAELEREKEELVAGYRPPLETLARGADTVALRYRCDIYIKGDCKAGAAQTQMSWDAIIGCLAPQMLQEVSEAEMREALEEALASRALADVQQSMPKAHAVRNIALETESFNQVKVQLRALGLIRKCPRPPGQNTVSWQLTPLGDQTMTQLLVRKR
ncbi:DUF4062 domain-containing protein [Alcanivorax quisquiliarum]|uniref:DUF4062 domain-containing protein n=1 Tax=Alcanivorax quisquiliarum TaxID=2933565 RepID=A0ABT0E8L8_9GAMM|nr:DUF4062 domain-containing protein [Alcanivorax quisquiliarum]MCK0538179.1 DUF4062 domain-containing protein [Alcanivorax quisquiliarum]